jgi:hypothetical protein
MRVTSYKQYIPLLVACSSDVMTPSLQKQLDEAGFDTFHSMPLKADIISSKIMPAIKKREIQLAKRVIINSIKDSYQKNLVHSFHMLKQSISNQSQ